VAAVQETVPHVPINAKKINKLKKTMLCMAFLFS